MRREGCVMRQEIMKAIALFILTANSFTDVRRHEISPVLTAAGGVLGVVLHTGAVPGISLPVSMLPGICFLLFSFLSRGAVGAGDGLVLIALAGCLPVTDILIIAFCGLFLASVYAGFMLLGGSGSRRSFAFVPFLLGGYVLYLMI